MRIDIEEIESYIGCPMKYVHAKETKADDIREEFNAKVIKTINSYYYNIMNGKNPSLYDVRKKWGSLWYKKKTKEDIMFSNSNTARNEMGMRGINYITSFYNEIIQIPHIPLSIEQEYCIKIRNHYLSGKVELIREVENPDKSRSIELVNFRMDDNNPDNFVLSYDLSITAQSYAFAKLFNAKEDRIVLYFLRRNKQYLTERDEKRFKAFENIIDKVAESIESEHFYHKYSAECRGCSYQKQCKIM